MTETREIRLEWNTDDYTFDDYTVPKNIPNGIIQQAIDLSLAYGEDEGGYFIRILREQGYEVSLVAVQDKIKFDFNLADNEKYAELTDKQRDEIIELKKTTSKFKPSKETKQIRLEWYADVYTFDDFIIPENTPNETIQDAIDIALAYNENESGYFVVALLAQGIDIQLVRVNDKAIFDFNTPLTEDFIEMNKEELDKEVKKITTKKTTTTKSPK